MPIHPDKLSLLANEYAKGMTRIRGRRVQRLLKREFAEADYVLMVQLGPGVTAVLGLWASAAALCATQGRGKYASVLKWPHGAREAVETRFDLLKDSLPVVDAKTSLLAGLGTQARLIDADSIPPQARVGASMALQALA